jgi:cytochrome c-type biogenesis protein CcmE
MAPRKVDRWWMVLVAFVAAAAMVLLVLLTESDQAAGTETGAKPATSLTRAL